MAKSLVEKFEQILSADPTSMVFVELAKSLLDQGEFARAAQVCRDGVSHHTDSILGRVLLGRALLELRQHDDATLEFERALAVDPDNPYGYNLVAEILMRSQLYGQALPVLERALELQPSDLRLREWITQARSGGMVPAMSRASTIGILDRRLSMEPAGADPLEGLVPAAPAAPKPPPPKSNRVSDMLLADLPEPAVAHPSVIMAVAPSEVEVQRIAQSFENKLREEFEEEKAKPKSFLRRHWIPITLAATAVVGVGAGIVVKGVAQRHLGEKNAAEFISRARQGLLQDTYASLTGAIHQLNELLDVQPHRGDALALAAQAQAMLCHDFNCTDAQRAQAKDWLEQAGPAGEAEAVLAARSYLASDPGQLGDELLKVDAQAAGPWVDYLAGNVLAARHQEAEAIHRYDQALKLQPAHVPTLVTVGEDNLQKGDAARASEFLQLAHTASPLHVEAAVALTEAHLATHEATDEDAKGLLQIAAAGANTIPTQLRQRLDFAEARALAASGKVDRAMQVLDEGLAQHTEEFAAYEGVRADCYAANGQYDRAETEAWGALSKTPKDPDALARYGEILLARGRAREVLARVPQGLASNRRLHLLRAQAAFQAGNLSLAKAEITATEKDKKVPPLGGALLAEIEAKGGQVAEAKQTLRQIAGHPHPPAEAFLGLARLEEGEAAINDARKAVAVDPASYETHCLLGRLLAKAGKADEARKELELSVRLNQQHVEARVGLALLSLDQHQAQAAKPIAEAAVRESPDDATANITLARVLVATGQNSDALRAAAKAVKSAPQDAKIHAWYGKVALAAGDRKVALRELREAKKLDKKDKGIAEDLAMAEKKH